MTIFESTLNQTHVRAPKGIVYGPPGIGKTTFGANTHKPIIVDCENGAAHVQCDRTPYLSDWNVIMPWLQALAYDDHTYGTVVIDSIDWLLRRLEERVAGVNGQVENMDKTMNRSHGGYVIENLKRMHDLPCIHICRQPLYPLDSVRNWIKNKALLEE